MEVHHHPQLEHKRKPWREYLLEGLMIFMAVTLGFFAEQIREGFADRHREHEYMRSMVEDLKSDTASAAAIISHGQNHENMIDSMIYMLSSGGAKENLNSIYFFARNISIPTQIFFNDRTIQQLKSSGSLRLISNFKVSNAIMAYDEKIRVQYFEMSDEGIVRENYRETAERIFDAKVFNGMQHDEKIVRPTNNPALFSTDPALVNAYIGASQYLKKVNDARVRRTSELLTQARQLIELIKNEYHLEDE